MGVLQSIGMFISPAMTLSLAVLKYVLDPLLEQFGIASPIDRDRRIDDHGQMMEWVNGMKEQLLSRDPYPSSPLAITWLKHVEEFNKAGAKIQFGYRKSGINFFMQCHYARTASKESKRAGDLVTRYRDFCQDSSNRCNYRDMQLGESVVTGPYLETLSRFIRENNKSGAFGIWGMGGVGKTALLESLYNRRCIYAPYEFLFVPAGRDCTPIKLQEAIADLLGLHLTGKLKLGLMYQIHEYLLDRHFILILDDMWAPIDLQRVGIPLPLGTTKVKRASWLREKVVHRKLILASRLRNVCTQMSCYQNTLHMLCPSEQDAMKLFNSMAGEKAMKNNRIPPLARQIVEECGRLPGALCKIGKALSIKHDPQDWMMGIESLRQSKIYEITHTEEDLLGSLRYSYEYLDHVSKPCFLICSLWQERENIPVDKLIQWWAGLGLLDGSHAEAYRQGLVIIGALLSSSLLENGDISHWCSDSSHVKMHDMVRHMATETVKKVLQEIWVPFSSSRQAIRKDKWYSVRKAWISRRDTRPWLKRYLSEKEANLTMLVSRHAFQLLPIDLFSKLVFLDMEGTQTEKFPDEICTLRNLEYLNLSSTKIPSLPWHLTRLAKLKYLLLRSNMSLRTIPQGLLARLQELQELDVFHTGLPSLLNELGHPDVELSMLGLTVRTEAEVRRLTRLSSVFPVAICLHSFEASCVDLQSLSEIEQLRELSIVSSSAATLVAESTDEILPLLRSFELRKLSNLHSVKMTNTGLGITSFQIAYCDKLVDVAWMYQLVSLKELTISYCKRMSTLFTVVSGDLDGVHFPNLRKIHLQELPQLSTVTERPLSLDSISLFLVVGCSKLRYRQDNQAWWNSVKVIEEVTKEMRSHFTREE